jgi:hypothetical protein
VDIAIRVRIAINRVTMVLVVSWFPQMRAVFCRFTYASFSFEILNCVDVLYECLFCLFLFVSIMLYWKCQVHRAMADCAV